ncbi:putative methyltransferase SAM dependent [gamma proteobacterium IMCC1989]|nr:putative methyltransferase SAM dependent [gamma proteobacterium IMCC1989]
MSFTPAKPVTSPQQGRHENLEATVRKHLTTRSQKPIAEHNRSAFAQARTCWESLGRPPTILDSGCGTGESTRYLANTYPDHLVVGIDRSLKRLENNDNQILSRNSLLLRAECTDFWLLAEQANWRFAKHTLFYPNPYPKPKHLQRRWHGDAAWTSILAISNAIELRTNWPIYADEFYHALLISEAHQARFGHIHSHVYTPDQTVTAFERKYHASGHALWQVTATHITPNADSLSKENH